MEEIQQTVGRIAESAGPGVVAVGGGRGAGSGVVIDGGKVLTNAHNVRNGNVTVRFEGGREATASVSGTDVDGDLAVLSVDTGGAAKVEWADTADLAVGTPVFAAANPLGRGLRVTFGLVSGVDRAFRGPRGRRITGSIEHTAPLARGSSGGPLFDGSGRFVGLNTNRLGDGFYLAIPADGGLRQRVDALARGESLGRPRLGIGLAPAHVARRLRRSVGLPDRDGVLISLVEPQSAADRAGLQQGDLIVEAGGRNVAGVDDLYEAVDGLTGAENLVLRVVRGNEERTISIGSGEAVAEA